MELAEFRPASTKAFDNFRDQTRADNDGGAKEQGRTGRLQLLLPEQSFQRLDAIKEATEASSYAEVLRYALRLYEGLLAERAEGKTLVVRDDASGEEVVIPLRLMLR